MKRLAIIDGDLIAYRIASSVEQTVKFSDDPDDRITVVEDSEYALWLIQGWIREHVAEIEATHVIVGLSCPRTENWRRDVWPEYKAHRNAPPPAHLETIKAWLRKHYDVIERPRLEADDLLGIIATSVSVRWKQYPERIIVSADKDLLSVPGKVWNPAKGVMTEVTEDEADYRHLMQTLTGDSSDGYPGCPGIGPVKAAKALAGVPAGERWGEVVKLFSKAGLAEEDALKQARVARILRAGEYNPTTKEVNLWSPS